MQPHPHIAGGDSNGAAEAEALLDRVRNSLEDDKAEEIAVIDLAGKTTLADYMVIASGRSSRQVAAIAEHLVERVKGAGLPVLGMEGVRTAEWVAIDLGDVLVHVFQPEVRKFYNLEKLWSVTWPEQAAAL
ncbi:MAG: ribosome silencing factor [Sneathiellaceae bacterium]